MTQRLPFWSLIAGALIGVACGGFFLIRLAELPQQQRVASQAVEHTLEVLGAVATVEADLEAVISETRGFIITRQADMRGRLDSAIMRVDADLAMVRALTTDNSAQQRLAQLGELNAARVKVLRGMIDRLDAGEDTAAWSSVKAYDGEAARAAELAILQGIKAQERQWLALRSRAARSATHRTTIAVIISCVIVAGSGLCLFLLVTRQRMRRLAEMSRLNADLEQRVASRTADLAASAARQRSYFDLSPVGKVVMRVGDDGQLTYEEINPAYATICGVVREAAIGRTLHEVWPEPVARGATQRMLDAARSGQQLHFTVTHEIGGRQRSFELDVAPLQEATGEAARVLVLVRDVTDQRALEEQLIRHAEQQAEAAEREMALFRNSADILFVVGVAERDGEPVFTYEAFSPSLTPATGWRAENLVGRRPDQTLPAAAATVALDTYRRCVSSRATISYDTAYETPMGRREYEGSITPVLHSGTGRIIRLVGGLRDVTERNQMQAALHHTQKLEAIGLLAAGVAHDFNNVLQSISGCIELMIDDEAAGAVAPATRTGEFANIALRAAKRGAYLTSHLLSYARKQILQPRSLALPPLLADVEAFLARTLGPHITVSIQVDAATPAVFADPAELETALLNLAINASHAMPTGGTLAIVAREVTDSDRRWAAITVTDTGIGMDAATLARATEPFFTTKGTKGTGLGLSMVQGFAEQSGGGMQITSKVGYGTCVVLRLPAAAAALPIKPPAPAAKSTGLQPTARILLVDDDPDVLTTVGSFLQQDGFEVVRASNGTQALSCLAAAANVDAMVTDFAMPGPNGRDLITDARLIRPGLPAMVISGFTQVTPSDAGDATVMLRKPFLRNVFIETVRRLLNGQVEPTAVAAETGIPQR